MLYILLVILASASLNILFRIFQRHGVNVIQAIVVNYVTAFIITISMVEGDVFSMPLTTILSSNWFYLGVLLGLGFALSMRLSAASTKHLGVGITTLMSHSSLLIPVTASALLFGDTLSPISIVAMFMVLVSLYFILIAPKVLSRSTVSLAITLVLPLAVLVLSGLNDVFIKAAQFTSISTPSDNASFISTVFLTSLVLSSLSLAVNKQARIAKLRLKTIAGGICMGVFISLNSVMVLKALAHLSASVVFPLVNIGTVLFSLMVGVLIFKEKLTRRHLIGIALALVAIGLLE